MPYIMVKCLPGRDDEKKTKLAQALAEQTSEIFGVPETCVTVMVEDVPKDRWDEEVEQKLVRGRESLIYHQGE